MRKVMHGAAHMPLRSIPKHTEAKIITVRVFNAYGGQSRPWYITKDRMTKKQFNKEVKWYAKRDRLQQSGFDDSSWDKRFINTLHD